jgi:hypothetical protein
MAEKKEFSRFRGRERPAGNGEDSKNNMAIVISDMVMP